MRTLINQLTEAIASGEEQKVQQISGKLDDLVFYLQDT